MLSYDELKSHLNEVAEILKKFPESVQPQVYELLMESITSRRTEGKKTTKAQKVIKAPKPKPTRRPKEKYHIVKQLDLRGNQDGGSFKEFLALKNPKSFIEFNAVSVYYLSETMHLQDITPDHIYTCYSEAGRRCPNALRQSLWDTAGKDYGYIEVSEGNKLTLSLRGKNFVEHDLPHSE